MCLPLTALFVLTGVPFPRSRAATAPAAVEWSEERVIRELTEYLQEEVSKSDPEIRLDVRYASPEDIEEMVKEAEREGRKQTFFAVGVGVGFGLAAGFDGARRAVELDRIQRGALEAAQRQYLRGFSK